MRRFLPVSVACLCVLAACGDNTKTASTSTTIATAATSTTVAGSASTVVKPTVSIPKTLPTKLVVTDLKKGTGHAAVDGDQVEVNYIGVRSADGTEFDNSYDRGQTFKVTLGAGQVIAGWDQGLVGIQAGGRRQLDIPSDLAYGDNPPGDPIKAGDALSFVIDAVSVTAAADIPTTTTIDLPTAKPSDEPNVSIPKSTGATQASTKDLVVGTGAVAKAGQTAYAQIVAYDGATGKKLSSTYTDSGDETVEPVPLVLDATQTIPGLVNGIVGMKVGGRRLLILPPADAFGTTGNTALGIGAGEDLILVVDLVLVADTPS
ncbi:MAG TPA: FKBP-type peptidyl-prolyl cis-trans isomerase [Ilumatobacteraceae bacterium]